MLQAFAENILLCGGGSGIAGLHALFAAEMQTVSPPSLQPTMCSCPDYMPESTLRYSSWMGAAILSKVRPVQGATVIILLCHDKCSGAHEVYQHDDNNMEAYYQLAILSSLVLLHFQSWTNQTPSLHLVYNT